MEEKKKKEKIKVKFSTALCIIIIIILLIAGGVLGYMMYQSNVQQQELSKQLEESRKNVERVLEENQELQNNKIENTKEETQTQEPTNQNNSLYGIEYIEKKGKGATLCLPQITGDTEGAKTINEKINKIYDLTDNYYVSTIDIKSNMKYKNNNILKIQIILSDEKDGGAEYYYYYNIDTKKEFTLQDVIAEEGFSLADINKAQKEQIAKYEETWQKENVYANDYTITGNEMFYTRNEKSEELGHYANNLYIIEPIEKTYFYGNGKKINITIQYKYLDIDKYQLD